jgi:hypothetical protein
MREARHSYFLPLGSTGGGRERMDWTPGPASSLNEMSLTRFIAKLS